MRTYGSLDRLTQEVTAQDTVNYTYDNASRRATMTVVGQPQVTYTYDNANRLTNITQNTSTVTKLLWGRILFCASPHTRNQSVATPKNKRGADLVSCISVTS
ncbi:MAG: hypothetical protein NTAFB01_07950 [Nitrospira sp.]